jgi:hypothetical protein
MKRFHLPLLILPALGMKAVLITIQGNGMYLRAVHTLSILADFQVLAFPPDRRPIR